MTDDVDDLSDYLTVVEAARLLGFSVRTLVRWIEARRIPSIVVSGETMVSRKALEAMVARSREYGSDENERGSGA